MAKRRPPDSDFESAYERARPFTLLPRERCEVLWREALAAPDGDFAEIGVYRGGSAMLLCAAAPKRQLHLFDTFEGHPRLQSEHDTHHHHAGRYSDTSANEVLERVGGQTCMWVGEFPGRLAIERTWFPKLALVHLDADLWRSTRDALRYVVPLLVSRGVVVCDDYGDADTPGVQTAVDECVREFSALRLEVLPTQQAILRREP